MDDPIRYRIVFTGTLVPEFSVDAVKDNLVRLYRCERTKIEALFCGKKVTLKRGLAAADADRYLEKLRAAGALAHKIPEAPPAASVQAPEVPARVPLMKPLALHLVPIDAAPVDAAQAETEAERPEAPPVATFCADSDSRTGKAQRACLFGSLAFIVLFLFLRQPSVCAFFAVVGGLLWWMFRSQLHSGEVLLTLDADGLQMPFARGAKRYRWREIKGVDFMRIQGNPLLILKRFGQTEGLRLRGRPTFSLAPFNADTQADILASVHAWLEATHGREIPDPMAAQEEELAFRQWLISLAPTPVFTLGIMVINTLIFILMALERPPNAFAKLTQMLRWGGNVAFEVQHGESWRLLTATFLHSGFAHLFFNMFALAIVGPTVERLFGRLGYTLIYLGAGLAGSALSLSFAAQAHLSVGASGAIFGVMAALLTGMVQHRDKLPEVFGQRMIVGLGIFTAYSLFSGFRGENVDNAAHVGGLIGGALLALALPKRFDAAHFHLAVTTRALLASLLLVFGLALLVGIAPKATKDISGMLRTQQETMRVLEDLDAAEKALQADFAAAKIKKINGAELTEQFRQRHIPAFQQLAERLSALDLSEDMMPLPLVRDKALHMARLYEELLSILEFAQRTRRYINEADTRRLEAIEQEMKQIRKEMLELGRQHLENPGRKKR
ncbi:MAG: rhomboid family intramembrane serine protease [Zoogloeaceae bacterium]|jgi:rhomboid protease GluP|nr:rhomboid family intramembrane serine protease [Zoogloeaceae bacterium]